MFKSTPFILILGIIAIFLGGEYLPYEAKQGIYTLSLSIKSLIIFLLPGIIFGLLFKSVVSLSHQAPKLIIFLLIGVCASNFLCTYLSHYLGEWIHQINVAVQAPLSSVSLNPKFELKLPMLLTNAQAMLIAMISGILMVKTNKNLAHQIANECSQFIHKILRLIVYLIPIFVFGYVIKLQQEGTINLIFKEYGFIFSIIALSQFTYIGLLYVILHNGNLKSSFKALRNMLPAAVAGFCSMSSAASLPLTLKGVEKNSLHKDFTRAVVPLTVNIHLIGDCIAIPIFAYAILKHFGLPVPSIMDYLMFTTYFVMAKFSIAGIPGGGILVMLPVLEKNLGFNADMLSLITGLYILFDPVITCANILGNGAFAKLSDRLINVTSSPKVGLHV